VILATKLLRSNIFLTAAEFSVNMAEFFLPGIGNIAKWLMICGFSPVVNFEKMNHSPTTKPPDQTYCPYLVAWFGGKKGVGDEVKYYKTTFYSNKCFIIFSCQEEAYRVWTATLCILVTSCIILSTVNSYQDALIFVFLVDVVYL